MPTVTITVRATTETPHPPTLSDGTQTTNTGPGDRQLTTNADPGSDVIFRPEGDVSITGITCNSPNNIFSKQPSQQDDGSWKGVLGSNKGAEEAYTISYTVPKTYTQDPKIRINK